jgi:UTP--glucose-1-phosphate uridylyltransferase
LERTSLLHKEPHVKVRKAVITAAAPNQRALPLQTLVDRDGEEKSVLGILVEQVVLAGIEEICVVVWPGDETRYAQASGKHQGRVRFIPQPEPRGYGRSIWCARAAVEGEAFLHLVGDHLYVNAAGQPAARQLVEVAQAEDCAVSAVQITRESLLPNFGAVGGRLVPGRTGLYRVETVVEKPTPTEAEQRLNVPGIRAGYYLCFFGMHVLTPAVMEILDRQLAGTSGRASLRRRWPSWHAASNTWRSRNPTGGTISAHATGCSRRNSHWRWRGATALNS